MPPQRSTSYVDAGTFSCPTAVKQDGGKAPNKMRFLSDAFYKIHSLLLAEECSFIHDWEIELSLDSELKDKGK